MAFALIVLPTKGESVCYPSCFLTSETEPCSIPGLLSGTVLESSVNLQKCLTVIFGRLRSAMSVSQIPLGETCPWKMRFVNLCKKAGGICQKPSLGGGKTLFHSVNSLEKTSCAKLMNSLIWNPNSSSISEMWLKPSRFKTLMFCPNSLWKAYLLSRFDSSYSKH